MKGIMDSLVGLTIGNFQIIELTGRGGMSSVYLAADKDLERSVALKIPHTRFIDDADFVKRFRREAKAMARLSHPNIVQIYSVGNHGEMPFFAMEHIHGEALSTIIKRDGAVSVDKALNYIIQIARAVEYAHKMDVIHRDIKPANILVDSSDCALVTDFGVSKMLSDDAAQDTMGFVGTPQYMSPEQCGQGTLDHRTDIYSLGAVFFELLTGQPPFASNSPAEAIKKQLFDAPEFPDEAKNQIPEKIQAIVCKMLAKDPEDRYPDIPTFLHEIEKFNRECDNPTFDESRNGLARPNGTRKTKDFISNVKGRRTRWPVFVVAGIAAVCLLVLSTSFTLSNGSGLRLGSREPHVPIKEAPDLTASLPLVNTPDNTVKPVAGPKPEQSVSPRAVKPGTSHPTAEQGEEAIVAPVTPERIEVASIPPEEKPTLAIESEAEAAEIPKSTQMVIDSKPSGAQVFLDSTPRGTTPLTLSDVAVGRRMLAMKIEGYPDYSDEIIADASNPPEIFHDFEAGKEALIPRGSLTIDSEPAGAAVFMDGEKKGTTPLELSGIRAENYTIELKHDGYENLQKQIMLEADDNLRLSLNLVEKPKFGDLSFASNPAGAEVLLNGAYKGKTPLILRRQPVGKYEVLVQMEGYEPIRREVACEKNAIKGLEIPLKMTPHFEALQNVNAGDKYIEDGEFEKAISAYEYALSLDPQVPVYLQKLGDAKRSLLDVQVRDLLLSYRFAYEREDTELLSSILGQTDPDFVAVQVSNADRLFQEFENIAVKLSDVEIVADDQNEVAVELHLKIDAAFAETGVVVSLLDTGQRLTLRKFAEGIWKLCAIE